MSPPQPPQPVQATQPTQPPAAERPKPAEIPCDEAYVRNLVAHLHKRFNLSPQVRARLNEELHSRITQPRRSEVGTPLPTDRLIKENESLINALRKGLAVVPKQHLSPAAQAWLAAPEHEAPSLEQVTAILEGIEDKLGDNQLGQVYAGIMHHFDHKLQRGQVMPVNWEGLRFRILAAADKDLTPRGHLNYFCSCAAKSIEVLSDRGFSRPDLRRTAQTVVRAGRTDLLAQRNAVIANRFQAVLGELGEVLISIQKVAGDILRNAKAVNLGRDGNDEETFHQTLTQFSSKQAKLNRTFKEVEETGIKLPTGLRERLEEVISASRELSASPTDLNDPRFMEQFLRKVATIKKRARGVTVEFRRIRRKTMVLVRKTAAAFGRAMEELLPLRIRDQNLRILTDSARELMWSLEDTAYALEVEEIHDPELLRLKASLMDRRRVGGAMAELSQALTQKPMDRMRLRAAGKRLLNVAHEALQHVPPALIARNEEGALWGAVADMSDAHQRFSTVIEGEDLQRLARLPAVLKDLQAGINAARPSGTPMVDVGSALQKEEQCQKGELRMSVQQRLDNLYRPLQELTKLSLGFKSDDPEFKACRQRALDAMGVTQEAPAANQGHNYLSELVVVPLVECFLPHDPTYGRSFSELEHRLRFAPVPGLLPGALLFAARQPNSLADLGDPESAHRRNERAREVVNRSGLVGQVMGLHPNWEEILSSDEAQMLATEMRPLFAGDAGRGFLSRLVANEEYGDLRRINTDEKLGEAHLVLEGLTSWDGFSGVQGAIHRLAMLLSTPQLAEALESNQDKFLRDQRGLLNNLNIQDPLEFLHPPELFADTGGLDPLYRLLDELTDREEELCLLQLHHRKFLQPEVLALLAKNRYGGGRDLQDTLPELVRELQQRYLWFSLQSKNPGERATARWLLEELGFGEYANGVDEGLPELELLKRKVAYVKQLRSATPSTLLEKMTAFFTGTERRKVEMEQELVGDFNRIQYLGFNREAAQLKVELNRP